MNRERDAWREAEEAVFRLAMRRLNDLTLAHFKEVFTAGCTNGPECVYCRLIRKASRWN